MAIRYDFTLVQGDTLTEVLRWADSRKTFKAIQSATQAAPCVLGALAHGMPDQWPFYVSGAKGMTQLNNVQDVLKPWRCIRLSADSIEVKNLNAANFPAYAGGGYIEYFTPVDLSIYTTWRMKAKSEDGATEYFSLTQADGIAVDNSAKTITMSRSAAVTAAYNFTGDVAVYDIEAVTAAGVVVKPFYGRINFQREKTN